MNTQVIEMTLEEFMKYIKTMDPDVMISVTVKEEKDGRE